MTTFDKREEGFEKKFAHDEELKFKAEARRNKLLGLWAAEKLGITGAAPTPTQRKSSCRTSRRRRRRRFQKVRRISTPRKSR